MPVFKKKYFQSSGPISLIICPINILIDFFNTPFSSITALQPKLFDYEDFFGAQIDRKKSDHTYRVFKKVMRRGREFPYAEDHSTGKKRDITVWCSNDYLGMSWHPRVINAVRWGFTLKFMYLIKEQAYY